MLFLTVIVKLNLGGCSSFVSEAEYSQYMDKAMAAWEVLDKETGEGNDFLGWKILPSETPETLIRDCENIRDDWKSKDVDLVVVIGIGGSYLGARCAIEALSHNFAKQLKNKCATGGTCKDGRIELQGDHKKRVKAVLEEMGFRTEAR
jgi:glucose-6-phosphate isomerase